MENPKLILYLSVLENPLEYNGLKKEGFLGKFLKIKSTLKWADLICVLDSTVVKAKKRVNDSQG